MIYLDTSAAAKRVLAEPESDALAVFLVEHIATPLVSSTLLYAELLRAVTRHRPALADRAHALLQRSMTVPLARDIVVEAATVGSPLLRTLDALHLATAMAIRGELAVIVTYDRRLADAAAAHSLPVAAPCPSPLGPEVRDEPARPAPGRPGRTRVLLGYRRCSSRRDRGAVRARCRSGR